MGEGNALKAVDAPPPSFGGEDLDALSKKFGLPIDTEHKSTVLRPWKFTGCHHASVFARSRGDLAPRARALCALRREMSASINALCVWRPRRSELERPRRRLLPRRRSPTPPPSLPAHTHP